ncbi:hypothetical protein NWFMUON74_24790 [Nocardia wallacei]|uniref:Uncharacterized protein n=1 Tax=Nocardia wallacei TaxID=480035 RepID=A0A7G1KHJ7_9NOCA|nr:hypothetical protein NWFMUON74_24790 [Nocardia wallacei]
MTWNRTGSCGRTGAADMVTTHNDRPKTLRRNTNADEPPAIGAPGPYWADHVPVAAREVSRLPGADGGIAAIWH